MKNLCRRVCSPILKIFESGQNDFVYQASHRVILIVVGLLFLFLSFGSVYLSIKASELGGIIPILGFFAAGFVCEVVGLLGTDRAVARIWKSK